MYHHAGKSSVVRTGRRAETEPAAFEREIHTGDKMNPAENLLLPVHRYRHVTGRIGEKQTHRRKSVDQVPETDPVQQLFDTGAGHFITDFRVISQAGAYGEERSMSVAADTAEIQWNGPFGLENIHERFFRIRRETHPSGKIISGAYRNISQGYPGNAGKSVQYLVQRSVAAKDNKAVPGQTGGEPSGQFCAVAFMPGKISFMRNALFCSVRCTLCHIGFPCPEPERELMIKKYFMTKFSLIILLSL